MRERLLGADRVEPQRLLVETNKVQNLTWAEMREQRPQENAIRPKDFESEEKRLARDFVTKVDRPVRDVIALAPPPDKTRIYQWQAWRFQGVGRTQAALGNSIISNRLAI